MTILLKLTELALYLETLGSGCFISPPPLLKLFSPSLHGPFSWFQPQPAVNFGGGIIRPEPCAVVISSANEAGLERCQRAAGG